MTNEEIVNTPIVELARWGLPDRVATLLETRLDAIYIGDLQRITGDDVLGRPDFGRRILEQIQCALVQFLEHAKGDSLCEFLSAEIESGKTASPHSGNSG